MVLLEIDLGGYIALMQTDVLEEGFPLEMNGSRKVVGFWEAREVINPYT